jgi:uncharacterized protein (TIGR04255 family)
MPFAPIERAIYKRNPLIEVVFQVRFPKFLLIETEPPAAFQQLIIKEYPIYEQRNVFRILFASPSQDAASFPAETPGRLHAFISADRLWTVTLAGDSLAVSTSVYRRWEDFRKRIRDAVGSLLQVYPLQIFTRFGLRYQNAIEREVLNLDGRRWGELLQPHVAGEFLGGALAESDFVAKNTVVTAKLDDGDMLLFRHGLGTNSQTQRQAYLIDADYYNEEQRATDLDGTLKFADRLHVHSGRLFRWCISDVLHTAMEPEPIL